MNQRCKNVNIEILKRGEMVTSMLKKHTKTHCTGAINANNGVDDKYVENLLKKYDYAVIAKSSENICGFLFLTTKKKKNGPLFAYIDLVCSAHRIGWMLLDFVEEWVRVNLNVDVVYLHAIDSNKIICMYANRGYREVNPGIGCKMEVKRKPTSEREKRLGIRMSKCVKEGKKITTKKLYPSVCDPEQNRQLYGTPYGYDISKVEESKKRSIQKPPSIQKPKLTPIEKMIKKAQLTIARRKQQ